MAKWRSWSDCGGDLESRISRDFLLSLINLYWLTGSSTSSMRDYLDNRRWQGEPGLRADDVVQVPTGVAVFPHMLIPEGEPPRGWAEATSSFDGCGARVVDRERVATVQEAMLSDEDVEQAADVFALLGDPNRLRLLVALLAAGEMCVCDLAASAGMSESATSHAVRWLRAHRIVSSPRRQGRMMYYRLEDAHVRMLLDLALTHTQHTSALHPERDEP